MWLSGISSNSSVVGQMIYSDITRCGDILSREITVNNMGNVIRETIYATDSEFFTTRERRNGDEWALIDVIPSSSVKININNKRYHYSLSRDNIGGE